MCGRTLDIVSYINSIGKRVVVISFDFEKCFDRVEHESLYGAMNYFGIGPEFVKMVSVFFNQF